MKRLYKMFLTILITFMFVAVYSQDTSLQINKLFQFEGSWKTIMGDSSSLTWTFEKVSLGNALYSKGIVTNKNGTSIYQADAFWTYDCNEGKIIILEVNSNNILMIHKGLFDSDNLLYLKWTENCSPEKILQESYIQIINKDEMDVKFKSYDGKNISETQYKLARIK